MVPSPPATDWVGMDTSFQIKMFEEELILWPVFETMP